MTVAATVSDVPVDPDLARRLATACDEVAKRFICPEQGIDVMVS